MAGLACTCTGGRGVTPRRRGELYATPVITVLGGCARGLRSPAHGGASPGHTIPRIPGSKPVGRGQPTVVRERRAAECSRAEPGRALRGVEQSADEQLRYLYRRSGVPLRWHGLPPGAASHRRRRTATGSRLPPHLVPHID